MEKKYECYLVGDKADNGVWKKLSYVLFTDKNKAKNFINTNYSNKLFSQTGLKRTKNQWLQILKLCNVIILEGE